MKGLGSYVRFIPKRDQETICTALSARRGNAVHRGMLPFIPVNEMETVLTTSNFNYDYAGAAQYQMMQQQHQIAQQNVYGQQVIYTGFGPGGSFGPGGGYGLPYQNHSLSYPNPQDCQFAYSALMVARAMMMKDQGDDEEVPVSSETEIVSQTSQ